jgi:hypothetical protein
MRKGHRRERQVLGLVFFGSAAAAVYYVAFRPPARLVRVLESQPALEIASTVVWAVLAAYCCRQTVQALLRLCGFG